MGFQYHFMLPAILLAYLSNCDGSCSQIQSCLEPLKRYDTFSKFFPGSDLNPEVCESINKVFSCLGPLMSGCGDTAVVVEANVIQTEFAYLCSSPEIIEDLRESFCVEEPAKGIYMNNIKQCFEDFQGRISYYVEAKDYCRASRLLKHCAKNRAGICGQGFKDFYNVLFVQNLQLPSANAEECYGAYLVGEFIKNRIVAGGETQEQQAIALSN